MKDFAFAGNYQKASQHQFSLLEINGSMYEESNPVGIKQLLSELGVCGSHVRLPLIPASEGLKKKITKAYEGFKNRKEAVSKVEMASFFWRLLFFLSC